MARILVADDDQNARALISKTLEDAGHSVTGAADGAAALKLAEGEEFDLVITDINMPEMNGVELTRLLGLRDNAPKVIAISGEDVVGMQVTEMMGAAATLTKPFTPSRLNALVARTLGAP
jgi:two-component system chemotaxis response regulator CheY